MAEMSESMLKWDLPCRVSMRDSRNLSMKREPAVEDGVAGTGAAGLSGSVILVREELVEESSSRTVKGESRPRRMSAFCAHGAFSMSWGSPFSMLSTEY